MREEPDNLLLEKAEIDKGKLRRMIKKVFRYYKSNLISRRKFEEYFRLRGLTDGEIEQLWLKAHTNKIIAIGVDPVTEEVMFELRGKTRKIMQKTREGND